MIRFRVIPFVTSIVVTSALAGTLWHTREAKLANLTSSAAPAQEAPRAARAPRHSAADSGGKFREFASRVSEMDIKYLDSLDVAAIASLAASAASIPKSDPDFARHIDVLAARWMELDPGGAIEWARSLPRGKIKGHAMGSTLVAWSREHPKEALDWFTALTGRRPREIGKEDAAMKAEWGVAAAELARMDFRPLEAIMADVTALPVEERLHPAQNSVYHKLAQEWENVVRDNGQCAKALALLAADQPLGDMASNFIAPVLEEMLPENPTGVMNWLEKHASRWSEDYLPYLFSIPKDTDDPDVNYAAWPPAEEVAAWFLRLPRHDSGGSALSALIHAWALADTAAAGAFLNRQPAGPDKNEALRAMALHVTDSDPAAALQWASAIRDESARDSARIEVLAKWHDYDPAEAAAWIAAEKNPGAGKE